MKINTRLVIALAAALAGTAGVRADAPLSKSVALVPVTIRANSAGQADRFNLVGLPIQREIVYSGRVTAAAGSSITQAGAALTDDQFNSASGTNVDPHSVQFTTGALRGRTFSIADTAAPGTISIEGAFATVPTPGDLFIVIKDWTLDSLFGNGQVAQGSNPTSGLKAGAAATVADTVEVYNATKGAFEKYFCRNSSAVAAENGWRRVPQVTTDVGSIRFLPDVNAGVLIRRKSGQTDNLVMIFKGEPKEGTQSVLITSGFNLVANPNILANVASTLDTIGMTRKVRVDNDSNPNTPAVLQNQSLGVAASGSFANADQIRVLNSGTGILQGFFFENGTGWQVQAGGSDIGASTQIPLTSAYAFTRRAASGSFTLRMPQRFTAQ